MMIARSSILPEHNLSGRTRAVLYDCCYKLGQYTTVHACFVAQYLDFGQERLRKSVILNSQQKGKSSPT